MEDRIQAVLEHMELEREFVGEQRAIYHMRRIGPWYIAGIHNAAFWRGELMRSRSLDQIREILTKSLRAADEYRTVKSTLTEGQ
jgi:tRNA-dihydrouridine synthase